MPSSMAFNSLPWYLTANGWQPELAPPLTTILKVIKDTGYDGVHADVPAGMAPSDYAALLRDFGLKPAPGYFQADFSNADDRASIVQAATTIARAHAELGLDRIFLAEQMGIATPRLATPAQGVDADPARLSRSIDAIGEVATAMAAEGVIPCLHLHVGTWIETVAEASAVLDAIPDSVLKVGPDSGHIAWTGADPVDFIRKYQDRIGAVHIKDIRKSVAAEIKAEGKDYRAAGARHIWTEPGRGDLDLQGVLDALSGFSGWLVVEVDIADQPTVEKSALLSAQWLRPRLSGEVA